MKSVLVKEIIPKSKSGIGVIFWISSKRKTVRIVTDWENGRFVRYEFSEEAINELKVSNEIPLHMEKAAISFYEKEQRGKDEIDWHKAENKLFRDLVETLEKYSKDVKIKREEIIPSGDLVTPYVRYSTLDDTRFAYSRYQIRKGSNAVEVLGIEHETPKVPNHLKHLFE